MLYFYLSHTWIETEFLLFSSAQFCMSMVKVMERNALQQAEFYPSKGCDLDPVRGRRCWPAVPLRHFLTRTARGGDIFEPAGVAETHFHAGTDPYEPLPLCRISMAAFLRGRRISVGGMPRCG
jgi:hypothetical protein